MDLTRRQFGKLLGIAPAVISPVAAFTARLEGIIERRVYDRAGAVPPEEILRRCGVHLLARENAGTDVALTIAFPSFAERVRAWDRFNSDPAWCALRTNRAVRLRELTITQAFDQTV